MTHAVEVVVPLVASNGNRWHEVRREVEIDPAYAIDGRIDIAVAIEVAGHVATAAKAVQIDGTGAVTCVELDPITVDPTGDPNEPAIRDENGRVDGRGIAEEDLW